MPSTTPSSVSRYRPAILVFTGAAAAYAAYLVYSILQTPPSNGLQRSNAVRRRVRRRDSPSARALSLSIARYAHELPSLGEYNLLGTRIPLNPHSLVTTAELRDIIAQSDPNAREEAIETAIADLYDVFLDRLLLFLFPTRPPSPTEVEAVRRWIGDRIPDNTAVVRAAERHTENIHPGDVPAVDGAESVAATELSWRSDEDTEGDAIDPDGQTLQRTLYHIAEDRARQEGVIHRGITCNGCDEKPIRGVRWHCANCVDFDLCSNCEATNSHYNTHIFYKIRVPAPYLGLPKQEPLYPGKPHMLSPSIDAVLRKRLVGETKMEAEEIEALWDQFSCLAGTEWIEDTTGVGWALDRRAFNHAFVPRYNGFIAAPNLIYDRIFAYYDTDKNGLIGFDEWIKGIDGMHTTDVEVKAKIVFSGYDIDGDGFISRKDILRIFRAFYAIEKEATRNYVAELTEDLSVRNALETIHSSQPLGSAFPPNNMAASNVQNPRLRTKAQDEDNSNFPVLIDNNLDVADRDEILKDTDLRNLLPEEMPQSEQDRIIADRWARREFYIDQEEGLTRPGGTANVDLVGDASVDGVGQSDGLDNTTSESERPKQSRSSSKVRFQDDVDVETRSNASTSSKAVGERWGGYEIPEPEKDLGKEVLYQITQQGFNELLNPLFQDKEDMAMDAYATRSERRKCSADIDKIIEMATTAKADLEAIHQVGIFRFSKCVVDTFCKALNSGTHYTTFKGFFQNEDGTEVTREESRFRLAKVYESAEREVIDSVKVSSSTTPDKMTLWNILLCRDQLQIEALDAVLDCVSFLGWISYPVLNESPIETVRPAKSPLSYRDPTMPQFRPNSLADIDAAWTSPGNSTTTSDDSGETDDSTTSGTEEVAIYCNHEGVDHIASDPQGPFFVFTVPEIKPSNPEEQDKTADRDNSPRPATPLPRAVLIIQAGEPPVAHESSSSSITPEQEGANGKESTFKYRSYTQNPAIHLLFVDSSSGVDVLRSSPRPVTHSTNYYQPETEPLKPLVRHIRQLAMEPDSRLHLTILASLETVEQEMSDRNGSGLINLDEFVEHMRGGRLRFLESWMEWVSI
ncbi:hypothetical protein BKA66DRAFT_449186 [Pyrenochaeta sp. MPI-SDFR-AT-0127]|nr:hypothetical protein BKA66DRAFT_449186 [Pyrenochaeta sp. MPI-SDFR-AT-0127]